MESISIAEDGAARVSPDAPEMVRAPDEVVKLEFPAESNEIPLEPASRVIPLVACWAFNSIAFDAFFAVFKITLPIFEFAACPPSRVISVAISSID